jgi:hypothetical protein
LIYIQSGRDLLQKEVKAIKRLCGPGAHVNIVQVLDHGPLSNTPYYFIDMELCDFNLHDYIHRETSAAPSESIMYFIRGAGSASRFANLGRHESNRCWSGVYSSKGPCTQRYQASKWCSLSIL